MDRNGNELVLVREIASSIAALQHCSTASLRHSITASLHQYITASIHHCIKTRLSLFVWCVSNRFQKVFFFASSSLRDDGDT
jgi:hypothetical protein